MARQTLSLDVSAWEEDEGLTACSLAAQQVWLRMCFVMELAQPYGFFVSPEGEPIAPPVFAARVGKPLREIRRAIAELEENKVFSRDSSGRLYCRRMVRKAADAAQRRENGKLGGNPLLLNLDMADSDNRNQSEQVNRNRKLPVNRNERKSVNPQNARLTKTSGVNRKRGGSVASISSSRTDVRAALDLIANALRDTDTESLRSSVLRTSSLRNSALDALKTGHEWPKNVPDLRALAQVFLGAFGNCFDPAKSDRHLAAYTSTLATFRNRGANIAQTWDACCDALEANGEKPLFTMMIRTAIAFWTSVSPASPKNGRPQPQKITDAMLDESP